MDPVNFLSWEKLSLATLLSLIVWAWVRQIVILTATHDKIIADRDKIIADLRTQLLEEKSETSKWEQRAWQSHQTATTAVSTVKEAVELIATKKEGAGT